MGKASSAGNAWSAAAGPRIAWPPATPRVTEHLVLLLTRELRVQDALDVVRRIRERGMPCSAEVPFGLVIDSPLAPGQPLTVRRVSATT